MEAGTSKGNGIGCVNVYNGMMNAYMRVCGDMNAQKGKGPLECCLVVEIIVKNGDQVAYTGLKFGLQINTHSLHM